MNSTLNTENTTVLIWDPTIGFVMRPWDEFYSAYSKVEFAGRTIYTYHPAWLRDLIEERADDLVPILASVAPIDIEVPTGNDLYPGKF